MIKSLLASNEQRALHLHQSFYGVNLPINQSFFLSIVLLIYQFINLYVSVFFTVLMADKANSSDVPRCVLDSLQKSLGSGSPVPGCTNTSVRAESRRLRAGYGSALITSR